MKFVVHEDPVGRSASHYIGRADLAPFGLDGQVEQLWFKPSDDHRRYELACIPFMTYGIALGDTVVLGEDSYVAGLAATAGHRTLRLLFVPDLPGPTLQKLTDVIRDEIVAAGLLSEWNGDRHVAVDVPPDAEPAALYAAMGAVVDAGQAFWEWATVTPSENA